MQFSQPNGVTFIAREWGDEFAWWKETEGGYRFVYNYSDGYYYYAELSPDGDYQASAFKVAIDDPRENRIPQYLERSPQKQTEIEAERVAFAQAVAAIPQPPPSQIELGVILVDFSDVWGNPDYMVADFDNMLFSDNYWFDQDPSLPDIHPEGEFLFGSMYNYYQEMSYGDFSVVIGESGGVLNDVNPDGTPVWITLPGEKEDYNREVCGVCRFLVQETLDAAAAQGIDITITATRKLAIIYAGNRYTKRLNPHYEPGHDVYVVMERWMHPLGQENPGAKFTNIGIHAHEYGHMLGLPHLRTNTRSWTLMTFAGNKNGPLKRASCPAPINPQFRHVLGWLDFQEVMVNLLNEALDYDVNIPDAYKLTINENEHFLVENRQLEVGSFNQYLPSWDEPANGGILIWHPVFDASTGNWKVDLEEADGNEASGQQSGDIYPGPTNNIKFASWTTPNSNANDGSLTDLAVLNISSSGVTMTASLYENAPPATPQNLTLVASGTYPVLNWNANGESDLDEYVIYRNVVWDRFNQTGYQQIGTTTNIQFTDFNFVNDPNSSIKAYYRIKAKDLAGQLSSYSNTVSTRGIPGLPKITFDALPQKFDVKQNYPNPFNAVTTLRYDLPEQSYVMLTIYDILGREVRTLLDSKVDAGFRSVVWDGKDDAGNSVSTGIYIYVLKAWSQESEETYHNTEKMVLLR